MAKYILSIILFTAYFSSFGQDCADFLKKKQSEYTDGYNYGSQSSFSVINPGDTIEVNAIMYSNKLYKIFAKNIAESPYDIKIFKTYRTYKRIVDTVIHKTEKRKIFKLDENSRKIPQRSADGTIKKDSYGDTLFVISDYIEKEMADTLWKMERSIEKHIIYNGEENNIAVYEQRNKRTQSIIIQVTMPKNLQTVKPRGDCVAILVGSKE